MAALQETPQRTSMDYVLEGIDQERTGRVQAVYALWEIYLRLPDDPGLPGRPGPQAQLLNEVGTQRNIAASRLDEWLDVPRRIPWEMLMGAFPPTGDGEPSWHLSLTWTHLETAAKVGGRVVDKHSPEERIRWLKLVADEEMSTADFENWLREQGFIKARAKKSFTPEDDAKDSELINLGRGAAAHLQKCLAGDYGPDVKAKVARSWGKREAALPQMPTTLCGLLRVMLDQLEADGNDKPLSAIRPGIFKAPSVLTKAAGMLTGIMFTLGTTEEGQT